MSEVTQIQSNNGVKHSYIWAVVVVLCSMTICSYYMFSRMHISDNDRIVRVKELELRYQVQKVAK